MCGIMEGYNYPNNNSHFIVIQGNNAPPFSMTQGNCYEQLREKFLGLDKLSKFLQHLIALVGNHLPSRIQQHEIGDKTSLTERGQLRNGVLLVKLDGRPGHSASLHVVLKPLRGTVIVNQHYLELLFIPVLNVLFIDRSQLLRY